jgi:hypothetical protein
VCTPPSIRLFCRPSNMFPRVKTPAAYVRVRCYPPARFSNFKKDFLEGWYHCTLVELKQVFGFMVWCLKYYPNTMMNEESGWKKKISKKKVGGQVLIWDCGLQCFKYIIDNNTTYNIYNTSNNTIYRRNKLTKAETSKQERKSKEQLKQSTNSYKKFTAVLN